MQTYLIIAKNQELKSQKIKALAGEKKLKLLDFHLKKIEDVRSLGSLVALSFTRPTGIIINQIDQVTTEAANALLKILEEPQANIFYLLTASNPNQVLPTILSRCQITRTKNKSNRQAAAKESLEFLKLPLGKKFQVIETLRQREQALDFIDHLLQACHQTLIGQEAGFKPTARLLALTEKTRQALLANGNIQLQLTNLLINL